jgi:hypothetical protein
MRQIGLILSATKLCCSKKQRKYLQKRLKIAIFEKLKRVISLCTDSYDTLSREKYLIQI